MPSVNAAMSPLASRLCAFLALELFVAASAHAFGLMASKDDALAAMLFATMTTFVFVAFFAGISGCRRRGLEPVTAFSFLTRMAIVPAALAAFVYHAPIENRERLIVFAASIVGVALWAIREAVRRLDSETGAAAVETVLVLQLASIACMFVAADAAVSLAAIAVALLAFVGFRLKEYIVSRR